MITTCDNIVVIGDLKMQLVKKFEMKDLVTLHYFLGIKVTYYPRGYFLFQSKYNAYILEQDCPYNTT